MATDTIGETFAGMHILSRTPRALREVLAGATHEDLEWQPEADRWSIGMVLAHLSDVEEKGFVSRFRAIAGKDNPKLAAYDQLSLFGSGARFEGLVELERFARLREKTLDWLKPLPASVMERTGRHEEMGPITFGELLHELAFHDLGHIRQIIELYRSHAFYPRMGGFQRYYTIHP